jgi:hypothetical protein
MDDGKGVAAKSSDVLPCLILNSSITSHRLFYRLHSNSALFFFSSPKSRPRKTISKKKYTFTSSNKRLMPRSRTYKPTLQRPSNPDPTDGFVPSVPSFHTIHTRFPSRPEIHTLYPPAPDRDRHWKRATQETLKNWQQLWRSRRFHQALRLSSKHCHLPFLPSRKRKREYRKSAHYSIPQK